MTRMIRKLHKGNNGGFTLVELIISIAILSMVLATACAFMVLGAKTFFSVNERVELSYSSGQALAQINQKIINSNGKVILKKDPGTADFKLFIIQATAWDDTTLKPTLYQICCYTYDSSEGTLSYKESAPAAYGEGTVESGIAFGREHILCSNITAATVTSNPSDHKLYGLKLILQQSKNGKTYNARRDISPRNHPVYGESFDDNFLWK
ncbi:MAG: type II secretion system GspH family protein [Lachnospiraceae bacterium]|nr:type II secretion system GspH family protein [Lachnospiraceae bacterium]MEE3355180.1 type II secretion system protein [Candidatus Weimeria sp.]